MKKQLAFLILFLCSYTLFSQENTEPVDSLRKDALNVYMSADDYIKREIPFINYVRDLKDAKVYIISTSERLGSGGREYYYFIEGQNELQGMRDTVSCSVTPDHTGDEARALRVATLKMGLMRYVQKTPLAKYFDIRFTKPIAEEVTTDKWDSWVFSTRINGYLNLQKSTEYSDVYGTFSASRVTKDWKYMFDMYYSQGNESFDVGDKLIKSENTSKSFDALIVKSINDHWSMGGSFDMGSSSYSNYKFYYSITPGIEFNIFPYSESTRRQFSFLYSAGFRFNNYNEITIYEKTNENLWMHSLRATYSVVQKWGNAYLSSSYSNYFHDWKLNYLSFSTGINLRITKGLRFNISGSTSLIHNQIALVKGGVSEEEILTRQKELETQYRIYTSIGLSYTFGSIFNNVVNPRFGN